MVATLPCKTSISFSSFLFCSILLPCIITLFHAPCLTSANNNETDKLALLAIKSKITQDPLGFTTTWNNSSHFCNWAGVTCGKLHQRVTNLNLMSLNLSGSLSPYIGNLTFLRGINLELNHFNGKIPQEIGYLFRLRHLNLTNNSFSGELPVNLSSCSSLVLLRLGWNNLIGKIPFQLGTLPRIERIHLHFNNLTGSIPENFANLSTIRTFSLAVNNLDGRIPAALGRLNSLSFLGLGLNQLSGTIPSSIFNMSSLVIFSLPYNMLHGSWPKDSRFNLPNLQVLNIGNNPFSGTLPVSLSNATNLLEFDITGSNFTGKVSIDFGGLSNLWGLYLASNPLLGKGEADDLNFLNSLTRCRNLQVLDLSNSQFGGVLPNSIANLSTKLLSLKLGNNQVTGAIPSGIENLVNLTELQLQNNKLTGSIPSGVGKLEMLQLLDLSENNLSGYIPSELSNITRLYTIRLAKNQLIGSIPPSFGNFQYLRELNLSQNQLNGTISKQVMGLSSLTISLNLAQNQFSGPLPLEVSALKLLGYLDVSENILSGEIPDSLGSCESLVHLRMEGNFFEGPIPPSFTYLKGVEDLDLSRNNLSGEIPEYFQRMSLKNLNLSVNQFEGEVPIEGVFKNATSISVVGNVKLCGGIRELQLPACQRNEPNKKTYLGLKLLIPLLSGLLVLVLIMSVLIILRLRKVKREPSIASSSTNGLILRVTYESLFKATGGFSSTNLIGSGSFGSVYKGILEPNETVVAVKVLNLQQRGAFKSFMAECEALRNIRHRNLVKVLTACSASDFQRQEFKALVYEFMPKGSLESWLHPKAEVVNDDELRILDLLQRIKIAIDVASALDYLHNHCHKSIVHCDLKPSNILLDDDMTAHVGDFGLAKFILEARSKSSHNQSSSIGIKGTIGYAAPEYGMGSKVSVYGDVYSFGILLLEMFTGKRPTEIIFQDELNLHNYVKMALPERLDEILDPIILHCGGEEGEIIATENGSVEQIKVDQLRECLVSILRIGIACSVELPRERMDINDVVKELQLIRDILVAFGRSYSSTSGSMRFGGSSHHSVTSNSPNVL